MEGILKIQGTSIEDYLKWWMVLQNPGFIKKDWSDRARSPQHPIDLGRKLSYGFGWFVGASDANPAVYHSGSNGGFRAMVFSIPQEQYAVIIFSNRSGTDLEDLVKEINKILSINNKSFIKLDSLISFRPAWHILRHAKRRPCI
jgi:CubicO group peptidase (beta-lactamase class C family)